MATSNDLVDLLKRELRRRGVTYAQLGRRLGISEASVKRMFSRKDFTLARLDLVCELLGAELSDLAGMLRRDEGLIPSPTLEQEKAVVADRKLLLTAVCVLNHMSIDEIVSTYDLTKNECVRLLVRLDRLGIIRLQVNNRVKLLVARHFSWLPDGPLQRFFTRHALGDYFGARFDGPEEYMKFATGMLSQKSSDELIGRLKRLAREFYDLHGEDTTLPRGRRKEISLLVALRPCKMRAFDDLRREKPSGHRDVRA